LKLGAFWHAIHHQSESVGGWDFAPDPDWALIVHETVSIFNGMSLWWVADVLCSPKREVEREERSFTATFKHLPRFIIINMFIFYIHLFCTVTVLYASCSN